MSTLLVSNVTFMDFLLSLRQWNWRILYIWLFAAACRHRRLQNATVAENNCNSY